MHCLFRDCQDVSTFNLPERGGERLSLIQRWTDQWEFDGKGDSNYVSIEHNFDWLLLASIKSLVTELHLQHLPCYTVPSWKWEVWRTISYFKKSSRGPWIMIWCPILKLLVAGLVKLVKMICSHGRSECNQPASCEEHRVAQCPGLIFGDTYVEVLALLLLT